MLRYNRKSILGRAANDAKKTTMSLSTCARDERGRQAEGLRDSKEIHYLRGTLNELADKGRIGAGERENYRSRAIVQEQGENLLSVKRKIIMTYKLDI